MKEVDKIRNQSGAIAMMAIFLVFFIAVLMITLEVLRRSDLEVVTNHIRDLEAYYCAESGAERIMEKLMGNPNLVSTTKASPGYSIGLQPCIWRKNYASSRTFEFDATNERADPNWAYYHYVHIISTGTTTDYSRRVKVTFRRSEYWSNLMITSKGKAKNNPMRRFQQIERWRGL